MRRVIRVVFKGRTAQWVKFEVIENQLIKQIFII